MAKEKKVLKPKKATKRALKPSVAKEKEVKKVKNRVFEVASQKYINILTVSQVKLEKKDYFKLVLGNGTECIVSKEEYTKKVKEV